MDHEEQLSWEQRVGRKVAIAAFASAALLLASTILTRTVQRQTSDTVELIYLVHENSAAVFASAVLQGVGLLLFAVPLWFLYKVIRYRREEIPRVARHLAILAPVASAVLTVVNQVGFADVASRLYGQPLLTEDKARDELTEALQVVGGLGLAANLAFGITFVLLGVNAMRAGVLSRFMGIIGVLAGILLVLPLFGGVSPVLQVFWVGALGMLFLGRWPQGGRGPAWETGEPIPWPTAADRAGRIAEERADREIAREEAEGREREPERPRTGVGGGRRPAPEPEDEDDRPDRAHAERRASAQHPRSKKRKRKRR